MSEPERAREPSMEEILASIRRIVSDNNQKSRPAVDEAPAYADEFAHRPIGVEEPEMAAHGEPAGYLGEHEAMDAAEAASIVVEEDSAVEDALAIADAEARQRIGAVLGDSFEEEMGAGMAHHPEPVEEAVEQPFAEPATPEASYEDMAQPGREESSFLERSEAALDAAFRMRTASEPESQPHHDVTFEREEPATMEEPAAMEEPAGMIEPAAREEDTRLLSSPTDASVASAFASLEKFVQSTHSRNLEEVVSGTLRPLLKEWLDANLPPLVERLVREEIERVSRGRR
ncbi:MAG: DUF2497 domain-containing protein [Hyphomicrobiales bacterium]|nr:DUF2497 domain-containing protein [Hyphomicrobiales bacterium]